MLNFMNKILNCDVCIAELKPANDDLHKDSCESTTVGQREVKNSPQWLFPHSH